MDYNYKTIRRKYKIAKFLGKKIDPEFQKIIDFVEDNFVGLEKKTIKAYNNLSLNKYGYYKSNGDLVFETSLGYMSVYCDSIYNRIDGFSYHYGDENYRRLVEEIIRHYYNSNLEVVFMVTATQN